MCLDQPTLEQVNTYAIFAYSFMVGTLAGGVWRAVGDSPSLMSFANRTLADGAASNGQTKPLSMFPVENFDLCYRRWEDDIIYDSEAVEYIPHPSLPQIDPNDPNFILGIPEEPPATLMSDKDKKVLVLLCSDYLVLCTLLLHSIACAVSVLLTILEVFVITFHISCNFRSQRNLGLAMVDPSKAVMVHPECLDKSLAHFSIRKILLISPMMNTTILFMLVPPIACPVLTATSFNTAYQPLTSTRHGSQLTSATAH